MSFDGASLRLVRRLDDGVAVVVWSLREGIWRRWASPVTTRQGDLQQAWLASQQLQGPEAGQLRLLDGVREWQVYFWRGQAWTNAQSSGDLQAVVLAAPASAASGATGTLAQTVKLPTGVRLQIDLPEGRIQRDVMLPPQNL